MPIYKRQRFNHSGELKDHLRKKGVGYTEYGNPNEGGIYIDTDDGQHIHVKEGEIGPATNYALVAFLSCAGLLLFVFVILPMLGG